LFHRVSSINDTAPDGSCQSLAERGVSTLLLRQQGLQFGERRNLAGQDDFTVHDHRGVLVTPSSRNSPIDGLSQLLFAAQVALGGLALFMEASALSPRARTG
jgi:hypothetical protein